MTYNASDIQAKIYNDGFSFETFAVSLVHSLGEFSPHLLKADPKARQQASAMAQRLVVALGDPVTSATDLVFSPFIAMAVRTGVDLDIFQHLANAQAPIRTAKLAEMTGGEGLLIGRILRVCQSIGYVSEVGAQEWAANSLTQALASEGVAAGWRFVWDFMIKSAVQAPKYFRENGHRCPLEPTDGLVQYAHNTKLNSFAHLGMLPSLSSDFNTFMGQSMGARKYWTEWFPIQEQILDDFEPDTALMVDVAGGKGQDLKALRDKFPDSGRLVLQELPQVLREVTADELHPSIERMEYDFFDEQPVKGARTYFFHHILHNWPNDYCVRMLKALRPAMTKGYSKLVIHELILSDKNVPTFAAIFDMTMMTLNGGMERSREQWTRLLADAGFRVEEFWVRVEDEDGIIEAVLADDA